MLKEMCKIVNKPELNKNAHEFGQDTKTIPVTTSPKDEKKVMCTKVTDNITEQEPVVVGQTKECLQREKDSREEFPYVRNVGKKKTEPPLVGISNIQQVSINSGVMMFESDNLSKFLFNDEEFQALSDGRLYYQGGDQL